MLFLNLRRFINRQKNTKNKKKDYCLKIRTIRLLSAIVSSSEETALKAVPQGHYRANAKLAIKKMCQLSISRY